MRPCTPEEIQKAIAEVNAMRNSFVSDVMKRLVDENRELRDRHAESAFIQGFEETF